MKEHVNDNTVDLIYLDPPFNSNADYNILFSERSGTDSAAQITAFKDTWRWDTNSAVSYHEALATSPDAVADTLGSLYKALGDCNMMAYLTMMTPRIVQLKRVLKDTGSIYLHCDTTASHYLRLLMDACFGIKNFRNEISWQRTNAHNGARRWGSNRDILLFYTATDDYKWNPISLEPNQEYVESSYKHEDEHGWYQSGDLTGKGAGKGDSSSSQPWRGVDPTERGQGRHWVVPRDTWELAYPEFDPKALSTQEKLDMLAEAGFIIWPKKGTMPRVKRYLKPGRGGAAIQENVTDIRPIHSKAAERLGFPTQKPVELLERIIRASSDEGDLVMDPFCGCGTALDAAELLGRRWIGIDLTHLAVALIKHRLADSFGDELNDYQVTGVPEDVASAEALALEDRHKFEWWAVGLVDALPANDKKKGADGGVDGILRFFDDNSRKAKKVVVQVKSGQVSVSDIYSLKGVREREDAEIALFITLQPPKSTMEKEALTAGFYTPTAYPDQRYRRVQILTIEELLSGERPSYPRVGVDATFRMAKRRRRPPGSQGSLSG